MMSRIMTACCESDVSYCLDRFYRYYLVGYLQIEHLDRRVQYAILATQAVESL